MNLSYVELYNTNYHGPNNINEKYGNHFIDISEPLSLEEFFNLEKNEFIITCPSTNQNRKRKLEITKCYQVEDQTFCILYTYILKIAQRKWKKKFQQKKDDKVKNLILQQKELHNQREEYHRKIKQIDNQIINFQKMIVQNCNHDFVKEREPGQYGELYCICKKCGYDRTRRIIF